MIRSGAPATPSITAKVAPFVKGSDVSYPDGIAVAISGITQGQVQGSGPGVIAGPKTTFRIVFTNKSAKSIDMNQVVVSVSYGASALVARPVYDDSGQDDFAGTVAPGKSINAVYAFSIPTAQLVNVVLKVDFDGLHAAATFTGKVATR